MSDLSGLTFGSYEVIRELGKGGMAVVYLGRQTTMDRLVAIKVISAAYSQEADFRARFEQESRTIARLEHPHILPVIDYGEEAFGAFLVMRYVGGGTLEQRLIDGPLSLSGARDMLIKIASALDYAHAKAVIHRDLKPANILLDEHNNPYLTDFGIAKLLQSSQQLTKTGAAVGTPAYMAPEQWKAEDVGPYTDQYALGVVLYEMVTGVQPFKADTTFGFMHKHVYEEPDPPTLAMQDLPPAAEEVILRALSKEPAGRFSSVGAMGDAFAIALNQEGEAATRPSASVYDEATINFQPGQAHTLPPDSVPPVEAPAAPSTREAAGPVPVERDSSSRRGMFVIAAVAVLTIVILAGLVASGVIGGRTDTPTPTQSVIIAAAPTEAEADGGAAGRISAADELTATVEPTDAPSETPAEEPTATNTATTTDTPTLTATPSETSTATATASATATATVTPSETPTLTPTRTDTPTDTVTPTTTATPTLDEVGTAQAIQMATLEQLIRDLTATSNAAVFEQATNQAVQTGTAIAVASFTHTPSPTATRTPTVTPSATSSPTRTRTPTSTRAPTLTPTRTPFRLPTIVVPTIALRATAMPTIALRISTATPSPTFIPTPRQPVSCPGLLPSRLMPGDLGFVSDEDPRPVNVRREPGLDGTRIGQFSINTRFRVLQGPVCESGYAWFRTERLADGFTGWIAESGQGVYYLEPESINSSMQNCPGVMPVRLSVDMRAVIDTPTGLPLRFHDSPGTSTPVTMLIANRTGLTVLEGVLCLDGYSWWKFRTTDGRVGWASEADNDSYFVAPLD